MLAVNIAVHLAGREAVKAIVGIVAVCAAAALAAYKISIDKGCRLKVGQFTVEPSR